MLKVQQETPRCDELTSLPGSFEKKQTADGKENEKNETHNTWSRWNFLGGAFKDFMSFFCFRCHFVYAFWSFVYPETLGI